MRGRPLWRTPIPWLGALLALYLLGPIAAFVARLAGTSGGAAPGTAGALAVSAQTATVAVAVIAVVGTPLAYLLARGRSRTSRIVGIAVQLPIAIPPLMSGILLLYLVGPYSPAGRLFGGHLTDNRIGIVLAQVFVAAPFLIVAARTAFAAVDPALEEVAATLGHGSFARFRLVAVPAAMPGIVAGLLLAWLRAFGEFGATVVLAYHPYSLPVFTFLQFGTTGLSATLLPTAAALGAAVVVLVLAGLLTSRRTRFRRRAPAVRLEPVPLVSPLLRCSPAPLAFDVCARAGSFTVEVAGRTEGRLAIVGRTGAGKSLALRALAGLQPGERSAVRLGSVDLTTTPVERRGIGYLPQGGGLPPQLPVHRQVRWGRQGDPEAAAYWLHRLDLFPLAQRLPAELSGGQRQRVAIARALASGPRLLLLDEPFAGLDTPARTALRRDLRRLQSEARITTVLVTHDPDDVMMLADDVVVIDRGKVLQAGPAAELYRHPASIEVAELLGIPNALEVTVTASGTVTTCDGVDLVATGAHLPTGARAIATIEPSAVLLGVGVLRGLVLDVTGHAGRRQAEVAIGPRTTLMIDVPDRDGAPRIGMPVALAVPSEAVRLSAFGD